MNRVQGHGGDAISGAKKARGRSGRLGVVAVTAVSAMALLGATSAQASTVSVGSVLPTTFKSEPVTPAQTLFNTVLPEAGANVASPVDGAIVRWRVQGAKGGPFLLRVLRPNGKGAYAAHGTSDPATPTGLGLQTFSTNIPVEAGDLIGIDTSAPGDEIGFVTAAGATYASMFPPPLEGATQPPSATKAGTEIELSAEIQPVPTITSVSPTAGSIAGNTTVTIKGHDFNGASGVKFGTKVAASFTVNSETEITATSPRSLKPGRFEVTVSTVAGESSGSGSGHFTYTACVVPKLKGKTLSVSKRKLKNAGCKLGKVGGTKSKTAKVVTQNPKAGKVVLPGSKVSVKVG